VIPAARPVSARISFSTRIRVLSIGIRLAFRFTGTSGFWHNTVNDRLTKAGPEVHAPPAINDPLSRKS
jgi:hypothetical protein